MTANRYQDDQPTRLALLEQSTNDLRKSLERIESNMDKGFSELRTDMNKGFSDVNKRIDDLSSSVNKKIDDLSSSVNNRLWRNFYFMIGGFAGLFAMIGHGFKWF